MRLLVAALAFFVSSAFAQQGPIKKFWFPPESVWQGGRNTGATLTGADGTKYTISPQAIANLLDVRDSIQKQSGLNVDLGILETTAPNAGTLTNKGRPTIAVSISYLQALGSDRDALASIVGHEAAHLALGHNAASREAAAKANGQTLGAVLNMAGIPLGGAIAGLGAVAYARGFTRDDERAADEQGMKWATAAGFDPCGKVRAVAIHQQAGASSFLDTHPGYAERIELANEYAQKTKGRSCQQL